MKKLIYKCRRCGKEIEFWKIENHIGSHIRMWFDWEERYSGDKPAPQEAGPRRKRHPKSVEGLGVKGEGEQ